MSEQELMSEEDKFFGVRTKIGGEQEQEEVVSAEAVEEEDDSSELGDEELQGYSKRVQKPRINKLRYETHEERRKAENAEKMRDEAYRVAQQIAEKKQREYESLIGRGEEGFNKSS